MHSQALAMDKYRLVGERKSEISTSEDDKAAKDEVRITQQGKPRNYITYAMNLFVSRVCLTCCRFCWTCSIDVGTIAGSVSR